VLSNFAFNFILRRYTESDPFVAKRHLVHERQGLTLVSISAQLEHTLPLSAQLKLTVSNVEPNVTRGCVPKVLKLSSNVSDVSRRSSS